MIASGYIAKGKLAQLKDVNARYRLDALQIPRRLPQYLKLRLGIFMTHNRLDVPSRYGIFAKAARPRDRTVQGLPLFPGKVLPRIIESTLGSKLTLGYATVSSLQISLRIA